MAVGINLSDLGTDSSNMGSKAAIAKESARRDARPGAHQGHRPIATAKPDTELRDDEAGRQSFDLHARTFAG
jgi:hypothetical protein